MSQEDGKKEADISIQHAIEREGRSKIAQYQDLFVGSRSLGRLVAFELVILLFSRIPGALGVVLRSLFYPMILGSVGRGVVFGVDVWLRHPGKIHIADGVIIDDGALLDAKGANNQGITLGKNCYIGRGVILSCKDGDIILGDYANLSTYCNISSNSRIAIGAKTLIGPHTAIFATSHNFERDDVAILDQGAKADGVTIEDNCWIGHGVSILDGVTIGEGTVVGAGSVVTGDLPPNILAVGAPARQVRERVAKESDDA